MKNTKIICTIGPSSGSADIIQALIANGMDAARFNFSHGSHRQHGKWIQLVRKAAKQAGRPVAIIQDLGGPKIRVGEIPGPGLRLKPGQTLVLTHKTTETEKNRVAVSYGRLAADVKKGDRILLADGMMELVVKRTEPDDIVCEVITGGVLTSHKGINLPTGTISADILTSKDEADLQFGLENGVDYIALSFVRSAAEIFKIKNIIRAYKKDTPVIAKIEKHEALANIEAIADACDGIMVARGDLGVEIPLENVPNIQKKLVATCNLLGKPVIIATQMLRSMVDAPRPTRAEAADVANSVLDGADAVMLSEETANGNYPVDAVKYMTRIINSAEKDYPHERHMQLGKKEGVSESVAYSACVLAERVRAAAIIATTRSGATAKQISRFRPQAKIISLSPDQSVMRSLALIWGCIPHYYQPATDDTDEMIEAATQTVRATGRVKTGEHVVITAGRPIGKAGHTNMLWVKKI